MVNGAKSIFAAIAGVMASHADDFNSAEPIAMPTVKVMDITDWICEGDPDPKYAVPIKFLETASKLPRPDRHPIYSTIVLQVEGDGQAWGYIASYAPSLFSSGDPVVYWLAVGIEKRAQVAV
jgi:hypothetical protein